MGRAGVALGRHLSLRSHAAISKEGDDVTGFVAA